MHPQVVHRDTEAARKGSLPCVSEEPLLRDVLLGENIDHRPLLRGMTNELHSTRVYGFVRGRELVMGACRHFDRYTSEDSVKSFDA